VDWGRHLLLKTALTLDVLVASTAVDVIGTIPRPVVKRPSTGNGTKGVVLRYLRSLCMSH
jgi:hypothetical protein